MKLTDYTANSGAGGYSGGSMVINDGAGTATATFTVTLYNATNSADNFTFTGTYTGGLYKH